jgi:hypothetical protein
MTHIKAFTPEDLREPTTEELNRKPASVDFTVTDPDGATYLVAVTAARKEDLDGLITIDEALLRDRDPELARLQHYVNTKFDGYEILQPGLDPEVDDILTEIDQRRVHARRAIAENTLEEIGDKFLETSVEHELAIKLIQSVQLHGGSGPAVIAGQPLHYGNVRVNLHIGIYEPTVMDLDTV